MHPFNEAGRRLQAALISYLMRRKGIDATLREVSPVVDETWAILAEKLLREMQEKVVSQVKLDPKEHTIH